MENRFNNRDFEQFVKQNADQYRMFPSEKVWEGIHKTLHTRRRWFGFGLTLLLLTTGVVTWVMLANSGKSKQMANLFPDAAIAQSSSEIQKNQKVNAVPGSDKMPFFKTWAISSNIDLQKNSNSKDISLKPSGKNVIEPAFALTNDLSIFSKTETPLQNELNVNARPVIKPVVEVSPINTRFESAHVNNFSFASNKIADKEETSTTDIKEIVSENTSFYPANPLTIESVINSYIHIRKKRKTSLQVYISPSISYRDLKENKTFINSARNISNGTFNTYYSTDINNVVTHKPDIGILFGFNSGIPLTKSLTLIGGFQFSINKYDIKAYNYPSEVATIALRSNSGGTNTVSTVTNFRNSGGSAKINWLHNLYFSASVPIGLELKLLGNRKIYLGISGTIQPTYVLRNKSYLLSTDYKNYAEIPSLIRKWNINTGFEIFAGYSTGKIKWRVGPQVRYQTMSSFEKKYPVQEHLFDFGLKFGIMLNK